MTKTQYKTHFTTQNTRLGSPLLKPKAERVAPMLLPHQHVSLSPIRSAFLFLGHFTCRLLISFTKQITAILTQIDQNLSYGAGELARWLAEHTALAEDWSLVLSNDIRRLTAARNTSSVMHRHTHT